MTYNDPATREQISIAPPLPPDDGRTAASQHVSDPVDDYVDDDEEWVSETPKGLRVRVPTGVLVLLLFAAIGLWGGSILQKHQDKSAAATSRTASGAAGSGAAARRAAGGASTATGGAATGGGGGAGGAGAAARAGATAGIVTDIQGSTIYLTDASGNLIKITTTPASTIRKTDPGTMADIKLGQSLIVTGAKAADGSTAARSITISTGGPGGGFGGFGGAGAGGG
jgi:hypothetical protein